MRRREFLAVVLLCSAGMALTPSSACAEDKVINITGDGTDAQYIEKGKTKQLNVVVKVGDTVAWMNNGDRTHTATSDVSVTTGKPLFDTQDIAKGALSTPIKIDQAFYDAAVKATGGKAGGRVHLGYYCAKHPTLMGGKLVLEPAGFKKRKKGGHE